MDLDVPRLIGAITRDLSTRDVEGAPAHVLAATRTYDAARDDVWGALTDPERIPQWFLPVSGELRPGGHYQLQGNADGEILACEPPARFDLTWGMNGDVSWVTVTLADDPDGGTRLRLEHVARVPEEFWAQYGPGAVGIGWDQALVALEQYLATGETVDPAAAAAALTAGGDASFMHRSGRAWCEASIVAGADPDAAREAAGRSIAFYTGA